MTSHLRLTTWTVLLWTLVAPAIAQKLVHGTVTDALTGEPLPAATVQVEGTYLGTITNAEGAYSLFVAPLPAVMTLRFIGYQTQRVRVEAASAAQQDVRLQPVALALEEVVVTGENPAERIMREVIARKQVWRTALHTWEADAYNRFTLANDTGLVSIMESLTRTYWDHERGRKEVVRSQRQTSNLDLGSVLPAAEFVVNLYDDDIEVGGHTLMGVTHPDALAYYDFSLEGRRALDGQVVYDIAVQPKSRFANGFVGRVSVLGDVYVLLEVALRPGEGFLFPPPIERYAVTYHQQFSSFGQDFWLPLDLRSEGEIEVTLPGLLAFPTIRVNQVSRLTNYIVNQPLPDSLYASRRYLQVDSAAVKADTLLDRAGVVVPLTAPERLAYATIDSTMTLQRAYQPTGPLARLARVRVRAGDEDVEGRDDGRVSGRRVRFSPDVWFNRVEALHVALRARFPLGRHLEVQGLGGYETGLQRATYGGAATVRFGPRQHASFRVSYHEGVDPRYPSQVTERVWNSFRPLFGGVDYFDYYANERWHLGLGYDLPRWSDTRLHLAYHHERHTSVAKTSDFDFNGSDERQRPNPPIEAGTLRSVGLHLAVNDEQTLGLVGQRRLVLDAEHSPDGWGDFSFSRLTLLLDTRIETFLHRRLLPNVLDVRVVAGTSRGTLPPQRMGIVEAATWLTPYGTLRTLQDLPYEGTRHAALFWEHNFRTVPFEALGWRWAVRRNLGLIVFGGHGRTWMTAARKAMLSYIPRVPDQVHHEVGVSLNGLFGYFRLDVARRLDAPGTRVGIWVARLF